MSTRKLVNAFATAGNVLIVPVKPVKKTTTTKKLNEIKNTWTLRVHKPESVIPSILGLNLYPFIDREPMACLGRGVYGSGYELGLRYPRGPGKRAKLAIANVARHQG